MIISTYDKAGNITTICENGVVIAKYVYDGLNRLISENNSQLNQKIKYEYDHAGNIVCKSVNGKKYKYSYPISGWRDKLLSFTYDDRAEECEYDAIGNPIKYRNKNLTWQGRRLKTIGSGTSLATYTYDADNVRTSKTVTDGAENFTCKFIYDGNTLVAEQRNSNWIYYIYGVDGIAGFRYNGVTYLYRKNIQGDITHIYEKCEDGSLNQVAHYAYDAFGNFKILQGEDENSIANINPFRYRGYYYDTETGLYYLISRYYDPETGRFISADSIEYLDPETLGGLNLYAYCCNNPVMAIDPDGTTSVGDWFKKAGNKIKHFFVDDVYGGVIKPSIDWITDTAAPAVGNFFTNTLPNFFTNTIPDFFENTVWKDWIVDKVWNSGLVPAWNAISNFFTNTVPDFFVNTVWKDWIVDKVWNKGILVAWDWLNGDKWYQIVVKNVILSGLSTVVGALIGGPMGAGVGFILGVVVGSLWEIIKVGWQT